MPVLVSIGSAVARNGVCTQLATAAVGCLNSVQTALSNRSCTAEAGHTELPSCSSNDGQRECPVETWPRGSFSSGSLQHSSSTVCGGSRAYSSSSSSSSSSHGSGSSSSSSSSNSSRLPQPARLMSSWAAAVTLDSQGLAAAAAAATAAAAPSPPQQQVPAPVNSSSDVGPTSPVLASVTSQQQQLGDAQQQLARLQQLIPSHELEPGLPRLPAQVRLTTGTSASIKLRRGGFTPARLFSLPGEQQINLALPATAARALVAQYGRNGLKARPLQLDLVPGAPHLAPRPPGGPGLHHAAVRATQAAVTQATPLMSVRVLPTEVHVNAVTLEVENLALLFCPWERPVTAPVPVVLWGGEAAPGVKAGGWLHLVERAVEVACAGRDVPPVIELDCKGLKLKEVIRFKDLPLPKGCRVTAQDPVQPVVRCAAKVGGN